MLAKEKYREELRDTERNVLQEIEREWRMREQIREEDFKISEAEFINLKVICISAP